MIPRAHLAGLAVRGVGVVVLRVLPARAPRSGAAGRRWSRRRLFRNRTSNLGLVTQTVQWLVLQGSFFVISVYLQQERGYSAIQTGLMLLPATVGILLSSAMAAAHGQPARPAAARPAGFTATVVGIVLLLVLAREDSAVWPFWPGLFLMGFGVGVMLTASVNVVQSAWPEEVQGDISGVSRSVSNLGSSLGVAIAGSIVAGASGHWGSRSPWRSWSWGPSRSWAGWPHCSSPRTRRNGGGAGRGGVRAAHSEAAGGMAARGRTRCASPAQVVLRSATRCAETTTRPSVRHCAMMPNRCDSSITSP